MRTDMHQDFDAAVRRDPEIWPVVEKAARQLDEESEGTVLPARARWYFEDRSDGRPEPSPYVCIAVEDETGVTYGRLSYADLVHPRERRHAVNWLWGEVLANRSDRLMRRRLAAGGAA